jgi:hypothetical protein
MLQPYRYLLSQDLNRQSYGEGYFDYTHTQWPRMGKAEIFYSPESSADEQHSRLGSLLGPSDGIRSRHKALGASARKSLGTHSTVTTNSPQRSICTSPCPPE